MKGSWLAPQGASTDGVGRAGLAAWNSLRQRVVLRGMSVCPICCGPFVRHAVEQVELELCSSCGAVWFDQGELAELIGSKVDSAGRGRRSACPSCRMVSLTSAGALMGVRASATPGVLVCSECRGCLLTRDHYQDSVAQEPEQAFTARPVSAGSWLMTVLGDLGISLLGS